MITPCPAFIDRRELGLCPIIGKTLEMRHVAAIVAYEYIVVMPMKPTDHLGLQSVGIAKAWGKQMRPLQLVGEGEILAPTAILAGRLEDVETFLAEEGTEGAGSRHCKRWFGSRVLGCF